MELLKQSRLLSAEQMDDVRDSMLLTNDVGQLLDMLVDRDILTEWQKTQLMAGRTGFFIGNYVLLGLLGRGGMGSVFLGRHTTMNRRCAVKVVSKKVGKDPDSLDQFLTEARAIASLDHPNIVQAYDVDKENDHFYIVMEYVEGQSLDEIIKQEGVLDCESAVDCIRQAAEGLAHAHGRNTVHCDIKPSNLLVNEQGVVKILDMGMARLVGDTAVGDSSSDSRSSTKILGTVDYMAPEQAVSAPSFDFRADVYSLGCTLFALLAGHPPFDGGNLTQRILKHQTQPAPDLRKIRPDVPEDLARICKRMMAKNPDDRYQTAREVADVLSKWKMPPEPITPSKVREEPFPLPVESTFAEGALGEEAVAGPTIEFRRPKRKNFLENERIMLPLLTLVVVVVVGILLFIIISSMSSSDPSETASKKVPAPAGKVEPVDDPQKTPGPENNSDEQNNNSGNGTKSNPAISDNPDFKDGHKNPKEGSSKTNTKKDDHKDPKNPKDKQPDKPEKNEHPKTPVNPLTQLRKAVDLPQRLSKANAQASVTATPLGPLLFGDSDGAKSIQIKLIGGDVVLPHNQAFTITQAFSEGLPKWTVAISEKNPPIDVAQIWIGKDNNLMFKWLNTQSKVPADYLVACSLDITSGKFKHRMRLAKITKVKPFRIIPRWPIFGFDAQPEIPANLQSLRLELYGYKGVYRNVKFDPSPVLQFTGKTTTEARLTRKGYPPLTVKFQLVQQKNQSRRWTLVASCSSKLADETAPPKTYPVKVVLDEQLIRNIEQSLQERIQYYTDQIEQTRNKKNIETAKNRKKILVGEEKHFSKLIQILRETMSQIQSIPQESEDIPDKVTGFGVFQFREYIETKDGGKLILLDTK